MNITATETEKLTLQNIPSDNWHLQQRIKMKQRLEAMDKFEFAQPSDDLTLRRNALVHLVGIEHAQIFLNMLEKPTADDVARISTLSIDALYAKYNDEVILLAALSRMISLMVQLCDNGESVVENIEKYGDLQGIALINAIIARLEISLTEERKLCFFDVATELKFPARVLTNVRWYFSEKTYYSRAAFDEMGQRNRLEVCLSGYYDPAMIAVFAPRVRIQWEQYVDDDFNSLLEFESDNGIWFTVGELLFKINNAIAEQCNEIDSRNFSGLELDKCQEPGKPPLYNMYLFS